MDCSRTVGDLVSHMCCKARLPSYDLDRLTDGHVANAAVTRYESA